MPRSVRVIVAIRNCERGLGAKRVRMGRWPGMNCRWCGWAARCSSCLPDRRASPSSRERRPLSCGGTARPREANGTFARTYLAHQSAVRSHTHVPAMGERRFCPEPAPEIVSAVRAMYRRRESAGPEVMRMREADSDGLPPARCGREVPISQVICLERAESGAGLQAEPGLGPRQRLVRRNVLTAQAGGGAAVHRTVCLGPGRGRQPCHPSPRIQRLENL
jgi:hypothetical protein